MSMTSPTDGQKQDEYSPLQLVLMIAGVMLLGALFVAFIGGNREDISPSEWSLQAQAEVEDAYSVELTEDEVYGLEFPAEEPTEDFVVYGTIQRDEESGSGFERQNITLIWSDGELRLAGSVDGEQFTELDR